MFYTHFVFNHFYRKNITFVSMIFLILFAFSLQAAPPKENDTPKGKALNEMQEGEILVTTQEVKGYDQPMLVAQGIFNCPPQRLWEIIKDCKKYPTTMQMILSAKELSSKGQEFRCEILVDLPWPMDDLRSVSDAKHIEKAPLFFQRYWSFVEGDYLTNQGSWTLIGLENGTKTWAYYEVLAIPKSSIPDFLKNAAQKTKIPSLFKHLRKQVEN
jgi:hypothetical protein